AMIAAARSKWRPRGWIAAAIHDRPGTRAAVIGHAAQLVRAGANMLWVSSAGDALMAGARLPAAPLADRLRNELAIATAIEAGDALLRDRDAGNGGGRADLVVVNRVPSGLRSLPPTALAGRLFRGAISCARTRSRSPSAAIHGSFA